VTIPYVFDTTRHGVQLTGTAYRYADNRVRAGVGVTSLPRDSSASSLLAA
jgi:hypothetical protein